jgi:ribose 5-phosphate isomerase B
VLALSLRATPEGIAKEILDAWFSTPYSSDEWNCRQMERIRELEERAQAQQEQAETSGT